MSTGSFASVLTGVGIVVSVYLAGIAGLLGLMSATGTAASKKLIKKAEKHEKTVSLAEAKHFQFADSSQKPVKAVRYQMVNSLR